VRGYVVPVSLIVIAVRIWLHVSEAQISLALV